MDYQYEAANYSCFNYLGIAWQFEIPSEYQCQGAERFNNCYEFVATIFTIWQAIISKNSTAEECFLCLSDSASAVGWLHHSSTESSNPPFILSREVMLSHHFCIYGQHIKGVSNKVVDSLSRRLDLSDEELTNYILSTHFSQVSLFIRVFFLHPEVSLWVTCWLH